MAEKTETVTSASARRRRLRLAQLLALVALLGALVGAVGPADEVRTSYSWPPSTLPEGSPQSAWYAPLLLIRHRPESLSATVPCSLPPALPEARRPLTVLATARFPERTGGLAVTREGGRLVVTIGREVLGETDLRTSPTVNGGCTYSLRLAGGRWLLEGGRNDTALGGDLRRMPFVSGFFTALDLRQGTPPAIAVTTFPHRVRATAIQTLAWALAALCAAAALLLVGIERRPGQPWESVTSAVRGAIRHARPVDAGVALALLAWWVLSPVALDDGWVMARERMFATSGGFSHYYVDFGANLPNDYWLEWAQHWLAESTLLVVRVPALLCLAVVWVLCRWILARVLAASLGESRLALWALASAFLVGALAWGMTVRPEPVTALFVTAVFALTVRFLERPSAGPLAAVALLLPFALTAHHAAVAALAPLLVASPALFRWTRSNVSGAAAMAAASIALLLVLPFIGSDIDHRRQDAAFVAADDGGGHPWAEEISRYALLADMPPLRRASVALIGLAVLAFVVRRRRERQPLLDLPATSLALGLVLFIATPSKLPWHFGALLGIAALAVAAETARLRDEASRSRGRDVKPLLAIGAAILAIAWSWSAGRSWGVAELRTLRWTADFEESVSLVGLAAILPLVLLAGAALVARARGHTDRLRESSWRVASWSAAVLAAPVLLFTAAILAADAAKTDTWTHARQNLGTFTGDVGCGLADDLVAAAPAAASSRPAIAGGGLDSTPAWVPPTPVEGLPRFALGPAAESSSASTPWFALPDGSPIGFFVSRRPSSSDVLDLEWGRRRGGRVERLARDEMLGTTLAAEAGAVLPWWFVAGSELPAAPPRADVVRVTLESNVTPGASFAVTGPVTYASKPLRPELERSLSLVFTDLLLYFPCVELPRLGDGIVEVPDHLVVTHSWPSPVAHTFSSPFAGILDLYRLERVPLADSPHPPSSVRVFRTDQRIPGALLAAAETS